MIQSLTRKEKEDYIEKNMIENRAIVMEIQYCLEELTREVSQRCKKMDLAELKRDKVGKAEFTDFLPDYLTPEALSNKINEFVDERAVLIEESLDSFKVSSDSKMVKIRQEFDMGFLKN